MSDFGYPKTLRGRALLTVLAIVQIVASILLAPVAMLWYGLHEMPGWFKETIRPAYKTIRHGCVGPYRGISW